MNTKHLSFLVRAALPAAAASFPLVAQATSLPATNITNIQNLILRLCTFQDYFFTFVMILAVLMLLVSAFYFLTGGDNATSHNKAKGFLVWGIVGIIVAILPIAIINIIANFFAAGPINPC